MLNAALGTLDMISGSLGFTLLLCEEDSETHQAISAAKTILVGGAVSIYLVRTARESIKDIGYLSCARKPDNDTRTKNNITLDAIIETTT